MNKLIPIGDRAILEEITEEQVTTKGGIIVPEASVAKITGKRAKVVALGEGHGSVPNPGYKVGDTVYYNPTQVITLIIASSGDKILIVNRNNILCRDDEQKNK